MAKVMFTSEQVVRVAIRGEGELGAPRILEDGGLVKRFLDMLVDEDIFPVYTLASGAGRFVGLFNARDASKVEEWLIQQGAKRRK